MAELNGKKVYRFSRLTPEREKKITELVELMKKTFDPLPLQLVRGEQFSPSSEDGLTTKSNTRLFCYAFLQSREWNVQKAFAMMKENVEFRKENKLDEMGVLPAAVSMRGWDAQDIIKRFGLATRDPNDRAGRLFENLSPFFKLGFHYWDRSGLPTLYVMLGSVREREGIKRVKQLAKVGQTVDDVAFEFLQHVMAVGEILVCYQQSQVEAGNIDVDASEGLIRSVNVVLDMKGLTYKHLWKPAIDVMRSCLSRLFKYYPDCVHRILVVNCPSMIMLGYNVVRAAVPATVQRKVSFAAPSETLGLLTRLIDPKYIPDYYGGACHCAGLCVHPYDPTHPAQSDDEMSSLAHEDVLTETIRINPGCHYVRVFSLAAAETVAWEFAETGSKGVLFRTYFVPQEEAANMRWAKVEASDLADYLKSKETPAEGADSYVASESGTLVLIWDNHRAWFSKKRVQMRVYKENADRSMVSTN